MPWQIFKVIWALGVTLHTIEYVHEKVKCREWYKKATARFRDPADDIKPTEEQLNEQRKPI